MGIVMQGMNLGDLIEAARHTRGSKSMSYAGLADKCGGKPTAARLQQYVKGDLKNFPDPESIRGLQRGTGRSQQEIIFASARSLGLQVDEDMADAIIIAGLSNLPDSAVESVKSIGRELVSLSRKVETHGKQLSDSQPTRQQRLRPVAPADRPGEGQKSDDHPRPNDIELDIDRAGIRQLHGDEAAEVPVPPEEQLAAHPYFETQYEKFDRIHGERGEESQDPGDEL